MRTLLVTVVSIAVAILAGRAIYSAVKARPVDQDLGGIATLVRRSLENATPAEPVVVRETRGNVTFDVAEVVHASNGREVPAWLVIGVDAARGVGVAYRVWQSDASRDAAVAVVERSLASYELRDSTYALFTPRATP